MEFWGVEVKPGQSLACSPGEDKYIHLSQVAMGEGSKSDERVSVYIHVDGKKIMVGSCLRGSCDQFGLDLVLEKDFKISHTSKTTSVFCCGYSTFIQEEDEDEFGGLNEDDESESESDDDEKMAPSVLTKKENGGKQPVKPEKVEKSESGSVAKPGKPDKEGKKVKLETPKQIAKVEDDDDSDDGESDDEEDEDMEDASGSEDDEEDDEEDSDDDDNDEDESEEETPKAPAGKKRPMPDLAAKTPVTDKKAKIATPQGHKPGDNKKTVHVATPHPGAKQGGKKGKETPGGPKQQTPVSKETAKSNASTPASAGKKFVCTPCDRNFASEAALSSHSAAKHGAKP